MHTTGYVEVQGWPGHLVGDDGSTWTLWSRGRLGLVWRPLPQYVDAKGYRSVYLSRGRGGKGRTCAVHRLVLAAFVGPCPDGLQCCHGNGRPGDNRLVNLRWDTYEANEADKLRHGRPQFKDLARYGLQGRRKPKPEPPGPQDPATLPPLLARLVERARSRPPVVEAPAPPARPVPFSQQFRARYPNPDPR